MKELRGYLEEAHSVEKEQQCKGPEARACMVWLQNSMEGSMPRVEQAKERSRR